MNNQNDVLNPRDFMIINTIILYSDSYSTLNQEYGFNEFQSAHCIDRPFLMDSGCAQKLKKYIFIG